MTASLDLIEFKKEHAHHMVTSMMNDPLTEIDSAWHEYLNGLEVESMSFTAVKNNEIICSGGIVPIWDGVYEGWVMASNLIWDNKLGGAKVIKKGMEVLITEYKIIRLQTAIKKDFVLGQRFGAWLGMSNEGLMKKYQNNEDYYRYARVND